MNTLEYTRALWIGSNSARSSLSRLLDEESIKEIFNTSSIIMDDLSYLKPRNKNYSDLFKIQIDKKDWKMCGVENNKQIEFEVNGVKYTNSIECFRPYK